MIKKYFYLLTLLLSVQFSFSQNDSTMIRGFFNEELSKGKSYEMLDHLSNKIGGRLSGSPQSLQAVEWGKRTMEFLGFDKVWLQEVMVPHWVRGKLRMRTRCALHGSGTGARVTGTGKRTTY